MKIRVDLILPNPFRNLERLPLKHAKIDPEGCSGAGGRDAHECRKRHIRGSQPLPLLPLLFPISEVELRVASCCDAGIPRASLRDSS